MPLKSRSRAIPPEEQYQIIVLPPPTYYGRGNDHWRRSRPPPSFLTNYVLGSQFPPFIVPLDLPVPIDTEPVMPS